MDPFDKFSAERVQPNKRSLLSAGGDRVADLLTGYEVEDHADYILETATAAGIDPRDLMGVLRREQGIVQKLPGSAALEALYAALRPSSASTGMGQMQRDTFLSTTERHPEVLGGLWVLGPAA